MAFLNDHPPRQVWSPSCQAKKATHRHSRAPGTRDVLANRTGNDLLKQVGELDGAIRAGLRLLPENRPDRR